MRIPSRIRAMGGWWKIGRPYSPVVGGKEVNGYCSPQRHTIAVKRGTPEAQAAETFFHELTHLAWLETGLPDTPHDWKELARMKDPEEEVVKRLSPALFRLIRDNDLNFLERS